MLVYVFTTEHSRDQSNNYTRVYTNWEAARTQLQWEMDNSEADRIDEAYINNPSRDRRLRGQIHGSALVYLHYFDDEDETSHMVEMNIFVRELREDAELGG